MFPYVIAQTTEHQQKQNSSPKGVCHFNNIYFLFYNLRMSRVTGDYRSLFKIWVLIKCSTGNKFHTQTPEHRNRNSTPEKGEMRIYQVTQESAFHALENVLAASISGRVQRENTFYLPKGTLLFMTRVVYECREVHFVSAYGDPLKAPLQWKIDRKWKQKTAR